MCVYFCDLQRSLRLGVCVCVCVCVKLGVCDLTIM